MRSGGCRIPQRFTATGGGEFWPECDSASNCAVLTTLAPNGPRGHRPRRRGPDALTPRIPQRLARSLALAHLIAELHRHAGHADILREQIDGAAGMLPRADNLPAVDAGWWPSYVERLEAAARAAGAGS